MELRDDGLHLAPPWISPAAGRPDREVRRVITVQRRAAVAASTDPFRSSRTLILHGTSFVDSSPSPASLTVDGSATISTSQSRFGGSSISFLASPIGSVQFAAGTRLTFTGNFTIEAWVFFPSAPTNYAAIFEARSAASAEPYAVGLRNVSGLITPELYSGSAVIQATATIATNTWTHVAWVRSGSTLTSYVNKNAAGTATLSGTLGPSGSTITIGRLPFDNLNATFFLDELIVTKGVALTTAQFAFDAQVPDL